MITQEEREFIDKTNEAFHVVIDRYDEMKFAFEHCTLALNRVVICLVNERLKQLGGLKTATARSLGISIRTLRNWINQHEELAHWRVEKVK